MFEEVEVHFGIGLEGGRDLEFGDISFCPQLRTRLGLHFALLILTLFLVEGPKLLYFFCRLGDPLFGFLLLLLIAYGLTVICD